MLNYQYPMTSTFSVEVPQRGIKMGEGPHFGLVGDLNPIFNVP